MSKNSDETFAGNLGRLEPLLAKLRTEGIGHLIAGRRVETRSHVRDPLAGRQDR